LVNTHLPNLLEQFIPVAVVAFEDLPVGAHRKFTTQTFR
jgi:small basic protein